MKIIDLVSRDIKVGGLFLPLMQKTLGLYEDFGELKSILQWRVFDEFDEFEVSDLTIVMQILRS